MDFEDEILQILSISKKEPAEGLAKALPALAELLRQADTQGTPLKVIIYDKDEQKSRTLAKRRHDFKGALRTLALAMKAIEGGYRFEDERAEAKIQAMNKALQALEKEAGLFDALLTPDS